MAESKITLTLGGKYTAGDAFSKWNTDVKDAQKSTKDMTDAARKSVGTLAGLFEGQLNGTLKTTYNLLGDMARGGLWGALGAIANLTLGAIIDKINAMREAAVKFAEIMRSEVVKSIESIGENFKKTSDQIDKTKADAKDLLDILNGEVAKNAQLKVHQLHIETLQKITDDMSKAGKDLVLADESYQAACIKAAAAVEAVENATKTSKDALQASTDKRVAAEEALADITKEREQLEALMTDYGRGWLAEKKKIEEDIAKNEYAYKEGLYDQATYSKYRKDLSIKLSKLEEEHKDELTQLNNVKKAEADASKTVEAEKRNEAAAQKAVTLAMQKEETVRLQAAQTEMDAEQKLKAAVDALAVEGRAATDKRIAAEEALAKATSEREKIETDMFDYGKGWLAERKKTQDELGKIEQHYKDGLLSHNEAVKYRKELAVKIAELESQHKDDLTKLNDAIATETKATEKLNEARKKEEEALKAVIDVKVSSTRVQEQANSTIQAASTAIAAEADSIAKAQKAADEKAYMDAQAAHILNICTKRQVDAAEYIQLFTQMIANGATETEAYAELQKKLNEEVKKRTDAEVDLTDALNSEATKKKDKDGKAIAIANVSIDPSEVGEGVEEWDRRSTYSRMREEMSQEAHKASEDLAKVNAEVLPFINLMKGRFDDLTAERYVAKLKEDFSPAQLQQLQERAIQAQILSKTELKDQLSRLDGILKCLEKQGLK